MKLFNEYIKMNQKRFALIGFISILLSIISIPLPYFSKIIIDNILLAQKYSDIRIIAIFFIVILLVQVIFGRINAVLSAKFGQNFNKFMKERIISTFINNDTNKHELGNLQNTIMTDTDLLSSNMMSAAMVFFSNISTIVGFTVVLFMISIKLTLITLTFVPIYLLWITHVSEKLQQLNKNSQNNKSAILEEVNNAYNNHFTIHSFKLFNQSREKFAAVIQKDAKFTEEILIYNNLVSIISGIIVTTAAFLPLLVGVKFVESNILSIGELIAFNSYCGLLFAPITNMIKLKTIIKTSTVYESRISNVFESSIVNSEFKYKEANNIERNSVPNCQGTFSIENYSLWSGNNTLIQNSNLSLSKGEVARLKGDNGTGKTTFLKSIIQDQKTYSGSLKLDGKVLNDLKITDVSNDILYVSNNQGFYLSTIEDNLLNGISYKPEELLNVLKMVKLDQKISTLEKGTKTPICEIINSFSNGELQKLRLARAAIRKPKVLLLDEVFSNIDVTNSGVIFNNLKIYSPESSIIIIEHHTIEEIPVDKTWIIRDKQISVQ